EKSAAVGKKKPLSRLNIHSAFWIVASIAVTYYFDFFRSVTNQADIWWFTSGSCLLVLSLFLASYCILYLEWYCGIGDYEVQYPALIPITTAVFIAAAI
ncbi:TM128 protein, partial [Alcedo cyanopectus]|nr:TM128 protein [Ceyx cyanopectus]